MLIEGYLLRAAQRSDVFAHILIWQLQVSKCSFNLSRMLYLHEVIWVCIDLRARPVHQNKVKKQWPQRYFINPLLLCISMHKGSCVYNYHFTFFRLKHFYHCCLLLENTSSMVLVLRLVVCFAENLISLKKSHLYRVFSIRYQKKKGELALRGIVLLEKIYASY